MDLRGNNRLLRSFGYAVEGILDAVKNERNMRIHIGGALLAIMCAVLLQLPLVHWMVLLLVIAGIFSLEVLNTAIERTVDLVTEDFHPLAKKAKDLGAAAVFIYSIFAVVIGMILFIPPLIQLFVG